MRWTGWVVEVGVLSHAGRRERGQGCPPADFPFRGKSLGQHVRGVVVSGDVYSYH